MATVASVPQVNVNSSRATPTQSAVSFSLAAPVPGVTASYYKLFFAPGTYSVTIFLPSGTPSQQASIQWSPPVGPPPSGGIAPSTGASWVAFGVGNATGAGRYSFMLSFVPTGAVITPVVASDPPPSVEFTSS